MDVHVFFFFLGQAYSTDVISFEIRLYEGSSINIQVSRKINCHTLSLPQSAPISEEVVLLMADVLAVLASSENGRQHLLFGEKNDHSDK